MIVLVGFMGAGKSTIGALLAAELGVPFVDADDAIEASAGISVTEIFETWGEQGFRQFERTVVADALARGGDDVLAVGGGALGDPGTRDLLERAKDIHVVYLQVGFAEALRRVGGDAARPMLAAADPRALYEGRVPLYQKVATLTVETDGRGPDAIAREVAARIGIGEDIALEVPTLRIPVVTPGDSYEVVVGAGIVAHIAGLVPGLEGAEQAFVLSHPELEEPTGRCAAAFADAGLKVHLLKVPSGEPTKSLATAGRLFEELSDLAAHRNDLFVAVGGGVVTDLGGFVASTFNRGLPIVHVATTLLAQVDAAIGGKTGINLPQGKNLVGTFHQPRLVLCDVAVLETLPERELRAGMAEVVKYGFISDPALLDLVASKPSELFARDPHLLAEIVSRSARIKAEIVGVDEKERGRRAILNYGHTFAHAIEVTTGYDEFRHGEAVALGMMAAAHLARALGRIEEEDVGTHRRVLEALGLPVTASLDYDALHEAWLRDKKYQGGVRFVLLTELGHAETGITAPREAVEAALTRLAE